MSIVWPSTFCINYLMHVCLRRGSYFCQHALYACAYGEGWLEQGSSEPGTVTEILFARVALGRCKDFGHRCRSERDHAASRAKNLDPQAEDKQFIREWPEEPPFDMQTGKKMYGHRRRAPLREPADETLGRYDSVAGTEGDLAWTAHTDKRFRQFGAKHGQQYVTFSTDQCALPMLGSLSSLC